MDISIDGTSDSLYHRVGGMPFFDDLTRRFYARIEADELLRSMHTTDLDVVRGRTKLFLAQYWGGPETYSRQRGHPRLRARHLPFPIDQAARDAWMDCMRLSVDESEISERDKTQLLDYFEHAATFMINTA